MVVWMGVCGYRYTLSHLILAGENEANMVCSAAE